MEKGKKGSYTSTSKRFPAMQTAQSYFWHVNACISASPNGSVGKCCHLIVDHSVPHFQMDQHISAPFWMTQQPNGSAPFLDHQNSVIFESEAFAAPGRGLWLLSLDAELRRRQSNVRGWGLWWVYMHKVGYNCGYIYIYIFIIYIYIYIYIIIYYYYCYLLFIIIIYHYYCYLLLLFIIIIYYYCYLLLL